MAAKTPDPIAGDRFTRLVVVDGVLIRKGKEKYFRVECDCGVTKTIAKGSLISGRSTSCGCFLKEWAKQEHTTHGKRKDPIYAVWNMMVQRCHLESSKYYQHYGARGIKVCDHWRKFENFYADVGDPPFTRATLDRIDNDKGYYKENVRWATYEEQQANTTKCVRYSFRGGELSVTEIAKLVGMNVNTLRNRLHTYGMTIEDATSIPVMSASETGKMAGNPLFAKVGRRIDGYKLYGGAKPADL